jgi:gliding motility-associated-like protein
VTYTQNALVKDTFKTSHGCDSMIRDINIRIVHFDLQASINLDNPYEGQEVTISTHSADGQPYSIYSWTPASAFADQQSLSQSFKATTGMTVVISGTSEEGCTDTAKVSFTVRPYRPEVMMPNAFTPNGDGINDVFMPVLAIDDGYQLTDFRIVNRWGQLLFSTAHVNIGWDGTFKGQLQSQDVYCYLVTIVFLDGSTKTFKGDVTLLR